MAEEWRLQGIMHTWGGVAPPGDNAYVGRSGTSRGSCICGVCFSEAKAAVVSADELSESPEMTEEQLLDSFHLMAPSREDQPILWNAISTYSSMRAREIADLKKWKVRPCTQTFRYIHRSEEFSLDNS